MTKCLVTDQEMDIIITSAKGLKTVTVTSSQWQCSSALWPWNTSCLTEMTVLASVNSTACNDHSS